MKMDDNSEAQEPEHLVIYGDSILSADAPVPRWLQWTYIILPIWGIIAWAIYWNGSLGFLDRGSWRELQEAANTTYPFINYSDQKIKGTPE